MESRNTNTIARQTNLFPYPGYESDSALAQKRLEALLAINAEIAREKSLFGSEQEKLIAATIKNPMSAAQTFAYFGLLLGTIPPLAIFIKFFSERGIFRGEDFWVLGVVAIINMMTAIVGYFSGKIVGKIVGELEKLSWSYMMFSLPFIGLLWGILTGGAGGVIVFVVGAFFGAAIGAMVGSVALPAFALLHRLLKTGDQFDRRHFLPAALGVTLIISAFILGL